MSGPLLLANVAAEEGDAPLGTEAGARAHGLGGLWRALFTPPPAFPWLEAGEGDAFAWLVTEAAAGEAEAAGCRLRGPAPAVVRRVHDKAFALEVARAERLLAPDLAAAITVLEPEELRAPGRAQTRIDEALERWPEPWRASFTLKPRLGTSARGRVAGRAGRTGDPALHAAFPRLAARGGALLEPWLPRLQDLSAQLRVDDAGGVVLLGTLEVRAAPAGGVHGHRGEVDPRGRVGSGSAHDEALREAAVAVAAAAAAEGFRGPCGVDAFVYADPEGTPRLRAVCELNARFTAGTVALGYLRRYLPVLRGPIGLAPGAPRPFLVALDLDAAAEARAVEAGALAQALPAGASEEVGALAGAATGRPGEAGAPAGMRPRLLAARDAAPLERAWAAMPG